jgi:hypothetical protein
MRTRFLPLAGLLLLAASPALVQAADEKTDNKPALVVAFKSLDGLISDAKYIAELAGKEEEAKQAEAMLKNLLGDKKGLEGVDPKKPIGLYAKVNADDPQQSEVVVLVPVADEDALMALLKKQDKIKVEDKAKDGTYQVNVENVPFPFFIRFANDYAYVTGLTNAAIIKEGLPAPGKVLPAKTTSLASVVLSLQEIPQKYKDLAISSVEQQLTKEKVKEQLNETPAAKAFRLATIDEMGSWVKSVLEEGAELSMSVDVDHDAGELSTAVRFSGQSGSKLAESLADLGDKKSVGASLIGADSAANLIMNAALPENLRKSLSNAVDDAVKKGLAEAAAKGQREAAEAVVKALLPTIKAGELDAGFDLRGPGEKDLYTLVMGLKVKEGGDIEKLVRNAIKSLPEKEQEKIKFDEEKAGDIGIHQFIPDSGMADENSKRMFGENPAVYFAFRDDALVAAIGEEGLEALKEVLKSKPKSGATLQMEASLSRFAPIMSKDHPAAPDAAKKAFKDGKKDKVRLVLEGGKVLTLKISMDAPVVTFSALMAEAEQQAKEKDQDK